MYDGHLCLASHGTDQTATDDERVPAVMSVRPRNLAIAVAAHGHRAPKLDETYGAAWLEQGEVWNRLWCSRSRARHGSQQRGQHNQHQRKLRDQTSDDGDGQWLEHT
jgi:hypothetical protein